MALPSGRRQAAGLALAVVALLTLPALIASPDSFLHIQGQAASGGGNASIWSAWYPLAPVEVRALPAIGASVQLHEIPALLRPLTHPLLVGSFLAVPLAVWAWRGEFRLDAERAIALAALLALLRCALDPVDNLYYHAPLLLLLLAWDAVRPAGRLPVRGLCGAALALLFWRWSENLGDLDLFSLAYVAAVAAAAGLIGSRLFGGRGERTVRARPAGIAEPG
jgi:hypothetical protein